eukprot:UN04303
MNNDLKLENDNQWQLGFIKSVLYEETFELLIIGLENHSTNQQIYVPNVHLAVRPFQKEEDDGHGVVVFGSQPHDDQGLLNHVNKEFDADALVLHNLESEMREEDKK